MQNSFNKPILTNIKIIETRGLIYTFSAQDIILNPDQTWKSVDVIGIMIKSSSKEEIIFLSSDPDMNIEFFSDTDFLIKEKTNGTTILEHFHVYENGEYLKKEFNKNFLDVGIEVFDEELGILKITESDQATGEINDYFYEVEQGILKIKDATNTKDFLSDESPVASKNPIESPLPIQNTSPQPNEQPILPAMKAPDLSTLPNNLNDSKLAIPVIAATKESPQDMPLDDNEQMQSQEKLEHDSSQSLIEENKISLSFGSYILEKIHHSLNHEYKELSYNYIDTDGTWKTIPFVFRVNGHTQIGHFIEFEISENGQYIKLMSDKSMVGNSRFQQYIGYFDTETKTLMSQKDYEAKLQTPDSPTNIAM